MQFIRDEKSAISGTRSHLGDVEDGGDDKKSLSKTEEAKLLRKIDFRVLPVLCVLYLLAFLDR